MYNILTLAHSDGKAVLFRPRPWSFRRLLGVQLAHVTLKGDIVPGDGRRHSLHPVTAPPPPKLGLVWTTQLNFLLITFFFFPSVAPLGCIRPGVCIPADTTVILEWRTGKDKQRRYGNQPALGTGSLSDTAARKTRMEVSGHRCCRIRTLLFGEI